MNNTTKALCLFSLSIIACEDTAGTSDSSSSQNNSSVTSSSSAQIQNSSSSTTGLSSGTLSSTGISSSASGLLNCAFDTTKTVYCLVGQTYSIPSWKLSFAPALPNLDTIQAMAKINSSAKLELFFGKSYKTSLGQNAAALIQVRTINDKLEYYTSLFFPLGDSSVLSLNSKTWYYGIDKKTTLYHRYSLGYKFNDSLMVILDYTDTFKDSIGLPLLKQLANSLKFEP